MNLNGGFVEMVKQAVDYTNRTGIDGLALSPLQLEMRMRVLRQQELRDRMNIARAVATAMSGDEKAWKELTQ